MTENQTKDRPDAHADKPTPEVRYRRGGLRALAATLPKITRRLFGRRGFAEGGLIAAWPEVVGQELAELCVPRRLTFPRRDQRRDGTLTLRVAQGHATTLQHLEPLIIERINGYFGYGAVGRLRLQQGPFRALNRRREAQAPLAPEVDQALTARLSKVEDETLRAALGRLGRAVAAREPVDGDS